MGRARSRRQSTAPKARGGRAALAFLVCTAACSPLPDDDLESADLGAQIEPDCSREGTFALELGEDRDGFVPLPEGAEPELYYGAQGGTHLILAGHITTPDPLDGYEMAIRAEIGAADCVDETCESFIVGGQFARVIEGLDRVVVYDDAAELPNLFLIVDGWDPNRLRKITLDVSDACGRSATDVRVFLPYAEHALPNDDRLPP